MDPNEASEELIESAEELGDLVSKFPEVNFEILSAVAARFSTRMTTEKIESAPLRFLLQLTTYINGTAGQLEKLVATRLAQEGPLDELQQFGAQIALFRLQFDDRLNSDITAMVFLRFLVGQPMQREEVEPFGEDLNNQLAKRILAKQRPAENPPPPSPGRPSDKPPHNSL